MLRKLFSLTLALLMFFVAERALAGDFGIGARFALAHNQSTDDNTSMMGAFIRLGDGLFGLEGAVDYRSEDLNFNADLRTWPVTASVLVRPIPIVFAAAGLGWYNTTVDYRIDTEGDDVTESTLGYQFGAGVELPVMPKLSFVGDLRYHFVDFDFDDVPSEFDFNDADYFSVHGGLLLSLP